jgi:4-hydroxy-L-threonine phosphate dehydrogenase PdxA
MKNKIIIISGDPNSINSEIIYKTWQKIDTSVKKKIYLISNIELLKHQFKHLGYSLELHKVKNIDENTKNNKLKVIDLDLKFTNPFKVPKALSSKFVIKSLNYAHKLALNKDVNGIINCAISKNLLNKDKIGVTEYLAKKNKIKNNSEVMLISNKKLSVSPITTHVDIKQISKKIVSASIINKIKTINNWFIKKFKKKPKIAILGLNPHNAELRKNSEEIKIIIPAISKLKKIGINLKGPFVSDTIFINEYKNYDVIVGMFHDQVLAPFKTLFKFDAINITLGLKYLRVSPDHGPAVDLIGKNKADALSLLKCINFINKSKR